MGRRGGPFQSTPQPPAARPPAQPIPGSVTVLPHTQCASSSLPGGLAPETCLPRPRRISPPHLSQMPWPVLCSLLLEPCNLNIQNSCKNLVQLSQLSRTSLSPCHPSPSSQNMPGSMGYLRSCRDTEEVTPRLWDNSYEPKTCVRQNPLPCCARPPSLFWGSHHLSNMTGASQH